MTFQKSARMAVLDGVNSRLTLNPEFTSLVTKVLTILANACSSKYMGSRPFHVRTLSKRRFNLRYVVIFFVRTKPLLIIKVYRICRRADLWTHISFTRVSIPIYFFEFWDVSCDCKLVGSRFTRGAPTFLSLIQHFRWIAVRLAMKRVISTIALHQIVAVLVRLFSFFFWYWDSTPFLVMLVNGEHRIGIYACTYTLHSKKKH